MSSQSRKEVPQKPATAHPAGGAHPAHAGGERPGEHGLIGEEVIHVPKGRNRLQFAFLIALLIFLTIIFLVPGAIQSTLLGSGRGDVDFLAFEGPNGKRTVLKASEYLRRRNGFSDAFEIFPVFKFFVGVQGDDRSLSEESAARLIVLDELARAAGIVITDDELAQFLVEVQAEHASWLAITSRYGGPGAVEPNLKRLLAIRRYLDLISQVARVPDMQAIEKRWSDEHVEVAYEYVEVPAESLEEEARAAAPDDAALEAWLAERPEVERAPLMDPARYRATFAVYRDPASTPATGLLERHPDPSTDAPEVRAQAYYDQVFFSRFIRPAPAAEEGEDAVQQEGQEPPTPYLSFEEAKERALTEAPIYFALQTWQADLGKRLAAGETVDLAAEAGELGLAVASVAEPATLEELRLVEGLGDFAVGPVATTEAGQFAPRVVADEAGLVVVRVDEKLEPALPAFDKIRDRVLASWAKSRAADLALERLQALRAGFETVAPEEPVVEDAQDPEQETPPEQKRATPEAFRAAAEAAGFTVSERPWLDKSGQPTDDPDAAKPAHAFLGQHREYAELDEGLVPAPDLDRQRAHAYLVRVSGKRPIDIARMTPQVYTAYKQSSSTEPANQVRVYLTGPDLDERYGITWLVKPAEETPPADEGAPAGEGAGG